MEKKRKGRMTKLLASRISRDPLYKFYSVKDYLTIINVHFYKYFTTSSRHDDKDSRTQIHEKMTSR